MLHKPCIIFSQNAVYLKVLVFSDQIILTFFINHALKFQYQHSHLNVEHRIGNSVALYSTYVTDILYNNSIINSRQHNTTTKHNT